MSTATPLTWQEWQAFRFPPPPAASEPAAHASDPVAPEPETWSFDPATHAIRHVGLRRQVRLTPATTTAAVVALVQGVGRMDLDLRGFIRVMDQACRRQWGRSLKHQITHHGATEPWGEGVADGVAASVPAP